MIKFNRIEKIPLLLNNEDIEVDKISKLQDVQRISEEREQLKREQQIAQIKEVLVSRVRKKISNRKHIFKKLEKVAKTGKNRISLTSHIWSIKNPLHQLSYKKQKSLLMDIKAELEEEVRELYGPDFYLDVRPMPPPIIWLIFYELIIGFKKDSLNSVEEDSPIMRQE